MSGCRLILLVTTALVAAACSEPAAPVASDAPAPDPATTAIVAGRVLYAGERPASEILRIDGDRNCVALNGQDTIPAEYIVLGEGQAVQNVFVYIKTGLEGHSFPVPSSPVVLDQQHCRYVPRVLGVRVGQPLEIRNSDPLLHNVRAEGAINQPFNMGQPVQHTRFTRTFTTREVMVPFRCDVHAWMNAYVGALEHPFFEVTGPSGAFALTGVPPGDYTIEAWHERLGTTSQRVTVGPKESKDVVFTFSG